MARATKSRSKTVVTRKRHSDEFKREALGLAEKIGVNEAARELGLHSSQLYGWRSKAELVKTRGQVEQDQAREIARLKRQLAEKEEELAIVKKAAAYFAEAKYAFMDIHRGQHRISIMARVLSVSRSGFYYWRTRTDPGP